jgi:gliding motility-associated-like protein
VNDLSICNGIASSEINISGNTPGTIYNWSNSNTTIGLPETGYGNIPIFIGSNFTLSPIFGSISLTPSFTDYGVTCLGQGETFEIQINPTPKLDVLDTAICSGEFTNLLLSADIQSYFEWSAVPNQEVYGETSNPIQDVVIINDELTHYLNQPQSIEYQITPTSIPYSCVGEMEVVEVIVHPNPNISFTTASNILCDLTPVQFINNSVGLLDFEWNFADGTSSVLNNPIHTYTSNGTYNVELIGTNPITGCSNQSISPLSLGESPNANFMVSDSLSCGPQDVVFTSEITNQEWQYIWDFGNSTSTQQVGTTSFQYSEEGCYDVSLTVTNQQQCISASIQENAICIFDEAIANFSVSEMVVSSLDPSIDFYNNSINASSFEWEFGDGQTSLAENPTHTFSNESPNYMVSLTAFNELGCVDTAILKITVWQDFTLFVPNSFTPNSDEVNQTFLPNISGEYKEESYQLTIYDRWGEIVFESKDSSIGWDGYNKYRKRVCQDGSYIWSIRLEALPSQEVKKYKGHVNLLR